MPDESPPPAAAPPDPPALVYVGATRYGGLPTRDLTPSEVAAWLPTPAAVDAACTAGPYRRSPKE